MKLSEIKTSKLLLEYIAEFIEKKDNLQKVLDVVHLQVEYNKATESIHAKDKAKLTRALGCMSKYEGGIDRIKKLSKLGMSNDLKKSFSKYID